MESADEVLEAKPAEPAAEAQPATVGAAAPSATGVAAAPDLEPPARTSRDRIKASPSARRLATESGLDLGTLKGSGPGGRRVGRDVEEALADRGKMAAQASEMTVQAAATSLEAASVVPVSGVRAVFAERMSESHRTTARVTLTME